MPSEKRSALVVYCTPARTSGAMYVSVPTHVESSRAAAVGPAVHRTVLEQHQRLGGGSCVQTLQHSHGREGGLAAESMVRIHLLIVRL